MIKNYIYEGEKIVDGEYPLGQLSKGGLGRVCKPNRDELYNDMEVMMDEQTFQELFSYISTRENSIKEYIAVVKNNQIVHVYG